MTNERKISSEEYISESYFNERPMNIDFSLTTADTVPIQIWRLFISLCTPELYISKIKNITLMLPLFSNENDHAATIITTPLSLLCMVV